MQHKQKDVPVPITIVGDKTISDLMNIAIENNSEHPKYVIILNTELEVMKSRSQNGWSLLNEQLVGVFISSKQIQVHRRCLSTNQRRSFSLAGSF